MNERLGQALVGYVWAAVIAAGAFWCKAQPDKDLQSIGALVLLLATIIAGFATIGVAIAIIGLILQGGWAATRAAVTGGGSLAKHSPLFRFYAYRKMLAGALAFSIMATGLAISFLICSRSNRWLMTVPIALGFVVFKLPDVIDRIQASRWYIRIFKTGGIPNGEFASNQAQRKASQSFRSIFQGHRDGGYLTNKCYLGQTLHESTGTRQHVWTDDYAGEIVYGCIGSGKLVSHLMILGSINKNSCVFISTKCELADNLIGHRSDPRWQDVNRRHDGRHPGVDARGITKVKYHIPGSRSFLCDPAGESVYADSGYPFLHEIDPDKPEEAAALISALAMALAVNNEKASDPFWQKNTRKFIKAGIGHIVTTYPVHERTLPAVADFLLGIDPKAGIATPAKATENLKAMMANGQLGGMIQAGAVQIFQLGQKAFGAINAGMGDAFEWVMSPMMRKHLSIQPTWSYRELGEEEPVSVFIVPPSIDIDVRDTFMRCHAAMSTTLMAARKSLPKDAILFVADEFPQYGMGSGIAQKALVLRSKRVKLILIGQTYGSMKRAVGEDWIDSLCSSSTERFHGINDLETAKHLSNYLAERVAKDGKAYSLASPQDLMLELDVSSNEMFVRLFVGQIMRLERRGYKSLKAETGLTFRGLPLEGHYDDTLAKIQ